MTATTPSERSTPRPLSLSPDIESLYEGGRANRHVNVYDAVAGMQIRHPVVTCCRLLTLTRSHICIWVHP